MLRRAAMRSASSASSFVLTALLLACGGGGDPAPAADSGADGAATTSAAAEPGKLTSGTKQEGEGCDRHFECAEGLFCAPARKCFRGSIGDGQCKANQDCPSGRVCDQRYTKCVPGNCGHALDCTTAEAPVCDLNGVYRGTPNTCIACPPNAASCK